MKVGTKCRVIQHILVIISTYNLDTEQNMESMQQHFKFDMQHFSRIGTNKIWNLCINMESMLQNLLKLMSLLLSYHVM